MTADATPQIETEWLTLADLTEVLGEPLGRVRRLLDELQLVGSRRDGVFKVPAVFIVDGSRSDRCAARSSCSTSGLHRRRGDRLAAPSEESIGIPPIEALRAGRKSEVRRVAQSLG